MDISRVSFIDDIFSLNEIYGYESVVDYKEVFDNLSKETKKDLYDQTYLYYDIVFEKIDTTLISHNIDCIHKISDVEVIGDIFFQRIKINSCDKKINKVGFKLFVDNPTYYPIILQYISITTPSEVLLFDNFNVNIDLFNCIFNCLFHIHIIMKNYKYDSLFSYVYHEVDLHNIKNIKEREIRLFGNREECSVCFGVTILKTICNHYLCRRCLSKIKNNNCPLCRKEIQFTENDDEQYE
jgi:hypothetical protein